MKKLLNLLVFPLALLLLVACGNSEAHSPKTSEKPAGTVRLVVKEEDTTLDEKVTFAKGDTVMDVLKANVAVKEKDGFITAIDGLAQNKKKGIYWMFEVNDELAPKAADQIKVKAGDKIVFYQDVFEN